MKKKKIVLTLGLALGMVSITGKTQAEECAVYKLYNRNNQEFLYTTNPAEYHTLSALKQAWVPEGRGFKVSTTQEEGYRPVFRYFHPLKGKHILTQNEAEAKTFEAQGWRNEGIAFFAPAQGKEEVYRVKNEAGSYRYPADKATPSKCPKALRLLPLCLTVLIMAQTTILGDSVRGMSITVRKN